MTLIDGQRTERKNGMGSHHSAASITDEWLTPREIVESLGTFRLDPCAPVIRPWPTAWEHYTTEDDGLSKAWNGRVWLNPPYGTDTEKWMQRLAEHGDGIALIFARTETATWFRCVWPVAHAVFFFRGRLHFCTPNGLRAKTNAGAPSALIAYGEDNVTAIEESKLDGILIRLR